MSLGTLISGGPGPGSEGPAYAQEVHLEAPDGSDSQNRRPGGPGGASVSLLLVCPLTCTVWAAQRSEEGKEEGREGSRGRPHSYVRVWDLRGQQGRLEGQGLQVRSKESRFLGRERLAVALLCLCPHLPTSLHSPAAPVWAQAAPHTLLWGTTHYLEML